MDESSIDLSRQSDALLQQGFLKIQFEYFTTGRNGIRYLVRANKTSLANFSYEPFWILLIAVPTRLDAEDFDLKYDIAKQFLIYKQLEATQKRICILSALGETTRAIAQQLGVSTKTVEKYRQRILDELGLDRTVEIVRLLVRFEERGLLRDFSKVD
ncbi:LuxR C-terminal-related transcriptional regulator [Rhodopirellula sp. MGV]|uniref:LuxR C-terminal-related transcriptional regulator n=1 Tax=Rhodopirellula sp. MGV TaxID=2023130 RepID=UPI0013041806|nr:LuxR C-terminal-related transcriptional regulator [Rhodopirellula sp. MGV]